MSETYIVGTARCTAEHAKNWALRMGAPLWWAELAEIYWRICQELGIRADIAYAQACHETGFGKFGRAVTPEHHNPCGLKIPDPHGLADDDPDAHQRFPSWEYGIRAHIEHLSLYARGRGMPLPYNRTSPTTWSGSHDPRHFDWLLGRAETVERLGGKDKWAPAEDYGLRILSKTESMTAMAPRFGIWKPLPEATSQPLIVPTIAIAHSIVGSAQGAFNYFRDSTNIESHWIGTLGGEAWQVMSADRSADANYKVNRFWDGSKWCGALSFETEDNGDPDNFPWTDAQIEMLIEWFRWCNREFGIPLRVCRTPYEPGIGYHTLHPYHWTNVPGKTCAGLVRNRQFNEIIVPALTGASAPVPEEDDDIMAKWALLIIEAYKERYGDNLAGHPSGAKVAHHEISEWIIVVANKPESDRHGGLNWIRQFELGLAGV